MPALRPVLRPLLMASALMVLLNDFAAARSVDALETVASEAPATNAEVARGGAGDRKDPFADRKKGGR